MKNLIFKTDNLTRKRFKHALEIANNIIEDNESISLDSINHPIYKVIHIFARGIQSHFLQNIITTYEHDIPHQRDINLFHPEYNLIKKHNIPTEIFSEMYTEKEVMIDFSIDIVLSFPWSLSRFYSVMVNIKRGEWEYKPSNHIAHYIEPFKIGIITNGYHSSTIGILTSQGTMPAKVIDMSIFYKWIYSDGIYYYNRSTNKKIDKVTSFEESVIYEIGRLIYKKQIKNI
ncbi:DUF6710 family protein [Lysinibacillus sp. NPDC096259]|uniref:DUF6710 family protein n=1 Tax=Lysinibacillus sp. NPDC096259 TaxID=3390583 RepID=UPI003D06CF41